MKFQTVAIAFFLMLLAGPSLQAQDQPQQKKGLAAARPVLVQPVVFLAPSNSRISFTGIHVGDDPKPRLGGFSEFQGYVVADPDKNNIQSLVIDINVDSVWTKFILLTSHLKKPDFFDTEKFPTARFVSTEITDAEEGQCTVTGDLTLHGATKSISFPAKYRFENGGLVLAAKFQLDRSQFGMDQMLSGVDKLVEVKFVVGQPTKKSKAQPGHGGDSKEKQSSVEPQSDLKLVSINLPIVT